MEDSLITFETAKLAKEKGFNIFTDVCFANTPNSDDKQYKKIKLHHSHSVGSVDSFGNILTLVAYAPPQSLLAKWLREMHKINVESNYLPNIQKYRCLFVPMTKSISIKEKYSLKSKYYGIENFDTYEEAFEIGLQEALKLIK